MHYRAKICKVAASTVLFLFYRLQLRRNDRIIIHVEFYFLRVASFYPRNPCLCPGEEVCSSWTSNLHTSLLGIDENGMKRTVQHFNRPPVSPSQICLYVKKFYKQHGRVLLHVSCMVQLYFILSAQFYNRNILVKLCGNK